MQRLDHFMAQANSEYYGSLDPFLDFTTSPEISQMFGEILGAWACEVWRRMGRPASVLLMEAGPGRGTLMEDALRVIARLAPAFLSSLHLCLVESSARLRAIQKERLQGLVLHPLQWQEQFEIRSTLPLILFANEFLDALPIRQFQRQGGGRWQELYVQAGRRQAVEVEHCPAHPALRRPVPLGEIVEINEPACCVVRQVSDYCAQHGGAGLFIDYGYDEPAWGDTLQAIRAGQPADPFMDPGRADITAHVDFCALRECAQATGVYVPPVVGQGRFLGALGIVERAKQLASRNDEHAAAVYKALYRLTAPEQMGRLFKVMAVGSHKLSPLPGFEI